MPEPAIAAPHSTPYAQPLDLETCEAINIEFGPDGLTGLVCWLGRSHPHAALVIASEPPRERLRDLQPGDVVWLRWPAIAHGRDKREESTERRVVHGVTAYR